MVVPNLNKEKEEEERYFITHSKDIIKITHKYLSCTLENLSKILAKIEQYIRKIIHHGGKWIKTIEKISVRWLRGKGACCRPDHLSLIPRTNPYPTAKLSPAGKFYLCSEGYAHGPTYTIKTH